MTKQRESQPDAPVTDHVKHPDALEMGLLSQISTWKERLQKEVTDSISRSLEQQISDQKSELGHARDEIRELINQVKNTQENAHTRWNDFLKKSMSALEDSAKKNAETLANLAQHVQGELKGGTEVISSSFEEIGRLSSTLQKEANTQWSSILEQTRSDLKASSEQHIMMLDKVAREARGEIEEGTKAIRASSDKIDEVVQKLSELLQKQHQNSNAFIARLDEKVASLTRIASGLSQNIDSMNMKIIESADKSTEALLDQLKRTRREFLILPAFCLLLLIFLFLIEYGVLK